MLLRRAVLIIAITALAALLSPLSAQAAPKDASYPTCNLPESDAEALVILNNYYPNATSGTTDLTVAVQATPAPPPSSWRRSRVRLPPGAPCEEVLRRADHPDRRHWLQAPDGRHHRSLRAYRRRGGVRRLCHLVPAAATTSWSAQTCRRAWTARPMTPSTWAG